MTTLINNLFDSLNPEETKSINQGIEFKKYQKKHNKYLNSKVRDKTIEEGFEQNATNLLDRSQHAKKSYNTLNKNRINSNEVREIEELKAQYNSLLKEIKGFKEEDINTIKSYVDIFDPKNKYHNKNVRFSETGITGYVTNMGDFKWYPNQDILNNTAGKNGCPIYNNQSLSSINGLGKGYNEPGTIIDANPHLLVGTPMQSGQSCGNEGNNVSVTSILPTNTQSKYVGCYTDTLNAPTMRFVGGKPTLLSTIVNGNFSQPSISYDSYEVISSTSMIPGWNFNAMLVNNSSALGYPRPYPNGNQCVSIQKTNIISQVVTLEPGTYTLTFFAVGLNCCDKSGQSNPIDIQLNDLTFFSINPPIDKWINFSKTFNVSKNGSNILSFKGTWSAGNRSTALQNIAISGGPVTMPSYTFDMCKEAAITSGNKYFSLQNINSQNNKGFCAVSNNLVGIQSNGTSYIISKVIPLWTSGTSGKTGCIASLTSQGALSIVQYNKSIFNTPNSNAIPGNYLGCYGDTTSRAMQLQNKGSAEYTYDQCKLLASTNKNTYFGLQGSLSGKNAQCGLSNDIDQIRKYGKAGNCTKLANGSYSGGSFSNAVYSNNGNNFYYLILEDNGNMSIYRGSGPNDNQGLIWSSNTNGMQRDANQQYSASNGKYGKNYIVSGATLSPGDFVGSTSGHIYLIMQTDGNLVLYTSEKSENCKKMSDNNIGGGILANAVYDLGVVGFPENIGKIGYVDDDGNLSEYPSSMKGVSSSYIKFSNSDSPGNDINGPISNSTAESCKTKCNTDPNCGGYVYDNNNKLCWPKNKNVYPVGAKNSKIENDLYIREPTITSYPGSTKINSSIDSITWNNYKKTGNPVSDKTFNNNSISITRRQRLDHITDQLNLLAEQITEKTNNLLNKNSNINKQLDSNKKIFSNSSSEINKIKSDDKTKELNNINGIVNDSNIVVLQENYRYLMWSILAIGVVSFSLNILKTD